MAPRYVREIELYADARGRSTVREELDRVTRSDIRGIRAIRSRFDLLRQQSFEDALRSRLIKKPSSTIYILRVQSGPVSFRIPFFEPTCRNGAVVVLTGCAYRRDLRGEAYKSLIEEAEVLRLDWIARNCKGR
jgi:hypothetical protein